MYSDELLIRPIEPADYPLLEDFLYEAIFIPEGVTPLERSIIHHPELQCFIDGFGTRRGDHGVVAEVEGKVVGCAWSRIGEQYGHIDDNTPSLSISLYPEYRNQGIGSKLFAALLDLLDQAGYAQTSLSVQKENYACRLYLKLGFEIIREEGPEYIMVRKSH